MLASKRASAKAQSRANGSGAPGGVYSLSFSQVANGASSGASSKYSVEDAVRVAACSAQSQGSSHYSVFNPIGITANNGLAIGTGTTMRITWTESGKPGDAKGFDIYRSRTGQPGTWELVNTAGHLDGPPCDDTGLMSGTYYYIVYLVAADDHLIQWTDLIVGVITCGASVDTWMLYGN